VAAYAGLRLFRVFGPEERALLERSNLPLRGVLSKLV